MISVKRIIAAAAALLVITTAAAPALALSGGVDGAIEAALEYECKANGAKSVQDWLDGALTAEAGEGAEGFVLALRQSGESYDFSRYGEALGGYVKDSDGVAAATRQKYALMLLASGIKSDYIAEAASAVGEQGIMSLVFGLHLINNGVGSERASDGDASDGAAAIAALLELRLGDGGWALFGEKSDTDVTAMALLALAPHVSDDAVATAVAEAVEMLSQRQLESGAFSGFGEMNAESTAQVITALSALGVDCADDPRFVKAGGSALDGLMLFRLGEGGFSHSVGGAYSRSASSQALVALVAVKRLRLGLPSVYLLDEQESRSGSCESPGARFFIILAVLLLAAVLCAALLIKGRRNAKDLALIGAVAAALIAVVLLVDISPASEYYGAQPSKTDVIGSVTISISCGEIAGEQGAAFENGVILPETVFELSEGETVYEILIDGARRYEIPVESRGTGRLVYITGIADLYEFDHGELSGWMFSVNGETPSCGCADYVLGDGDVVEWRYSLALGREERQS